MGRDIKVPDEYHTTKFTVFLYPRSTTCKNAGRQFGVVNCTNTRTHKKFSRFGQLWDFMTRQASVVEKREVSFPKK